MITPEILFWTQIASVVAFMVTLFVLYRVLVQQKDATIQLLKEKNSHLKDQLATAMELSPDVLAESLARRVRTFEGELKRLEDDKSATEDEVKAKEAELAHARDEAETLTKKILNAQELLSDFLCPNCRAPLAEKVYHSESVEYQGHEVDVDHDYTLFECGYEIIDGEGRGQCKATAKSKFASPGQG